MKFKIGDRVKIVTERVGTIKNYNNRIDSYHVMFDDASSDFGEWRKENVLEPVERVDGWTLCKDALPEKEGQYLTCVKGSNMPFIFVFNGTGFISPRVYAWMPLPEIAEDPTKLEFKIGSSYRTRGRGIFKCIDIVDDHAVLYNRGYGVFRVFLETGKYRPQLEGERFYDHPCDVIEEVANE